MIQETALVFSHYRDAELRGAGLVARLHKFEELADRETQMNLSNHLAEEAHHARLWMEVMDTRGMTPVPVVDGYYDVLNRNLSGIRPRTVSDYLAVSIVVERRALARYGQHLRQSGVTPQVRGTLEDVSQDEAWHVQWMVQKGRSLEPVEDFRARIDKYRDADEKTIQELVEREHAASVDVGIERP